MGITKKSGYEIKLMREAGRVVALVHAEMKKIIKPGVTTQYLNDTAYQIIKDNKCDPTFLGYNGFPATICASVNEQVVHGFPSDRVLKDGDIISVDVGATYRGYVGDSAWTYAVGEISDECKKLMEITEKALFAGLANLKDGNNLDDVSGAIEDTALANNYGIVRQYGGHGVGSKMHEEPFVYNYRVNNNLILKRGMTIAIEPMLNLGGDDVEVLEDEWTVITKDRRPSAHFEHTALVTDTGADILTKLPD
ncbi:MAG: type I methionyl aminopeptidase [Candidatus Gastranaerophilales bacterium]|nr:type I methionyl aminopeptidase [Candidatus Gastranaerophilales bacterium]